jgi:hypothetical protein
VLSFRWAALPFVAGQLEPEDPANWGVIRDLRDILKSDVLQHGCATDNFGGPDADGTAAEIF